MKQNLKMMKIVEGTIIKGKDVKKYTNVSEADQVNGLIIAAELDAPIYSPCTGQVANVGGNLLDGNWIRIQAGLYTYIFNHLHQTFVGTGNIVKKGQLIGNVGMSGLAIKPHLRYEVNKNFKPINPTDFIDI